MSIQGLARDIMEGTAPDCFGTKLLTPFLSVGEWFYRKGYERDRDQYLKNPAARARLAFPVISVGNLTWGGTGKTPLVEAIARKVLAAKKTPLILSRGYSHDEVEQMKSHLEGALMASGKDRVLAAKEVLRDYHVDLGVLDDGMQHWPIERDLEIVTINALNPFGNGKLIPRGILREPLSALQRAHIVVLMHVSFLKTQDLRDLRKKVAELAPQAKLVQAYIEPLFFYRGRDHLRVSLEKMRGKRVTAFSGIGAPRTFQLILQRSKVKPVRSFEYRDHYEFKKKDLEEIKKISDLADAEEIVTTEKDFYRCKKLLSETLDPLVLATRVQFMSGEDILDDAIMNLVGVKRR
ncbi:MAG TPA: tetraacyldisaccharide 4'-kinase [Candidatus Omnitrophica bacterium]|nr:tetraacyldisaccharide 4'-kinase [Candidatus Omnitrophota bacterium]